VARVGSLPLRLAHGMRYRAYRPLDHAGLRWYRDETSTYRFTANYLVPAGVTLMAQLTIEGLENVPRGGAVILAANHCDNLDSPLLMHAVPRVLHFAARPDGFGTGGVRLLAAPGRISCRWLGYAAWAEFVGGRQSRGSVRPGQDLNATRDELRRRRTTGAPLTCASCTRCDQRDRSGTRELPVRYTSSHPNLLRCSLDLPR
jgi:hypothetical protein